MQKTWDAITWVRSNRYMVDQAFEVITEAQRTCQINPEERDKDENAIAEIAAPKMKQHFGTQHPDPSVDWVIFSVHMVRDFRNSNGLSEAVIDQQ